MPKKQTRAATGPVPDRLKIEGDWTIAAARLVQVKKPADGWPDAKPKKKAAKKSKRK